MTVIFKCDVCEKEEPGRYDGGYLCGLDVWLSPDNASGCWRVENGLLLCTDCHPKQKKDASR